MSKYFSSLRKEVLDGVEGKNSGIPMGFNRLNNYISIRKSTYYLIGGFTGSGKSSFVDDAFILNPLDYLLLHPPNNGLDLNIIYFSMERRVNFKLAKWVARRIFLDEGEIIPINRLMGWVGKNERLTPREIDLFNRYEDYIESLMEKIIMIPGPQNPTGMKKFVEDVYAKKHGTLDTTNKYVPKYIPNNNNLITLIITDHIGLTKYETGLTSKKAVIDKSSEHKQRWRDLYGFSPIDVSQFNRDIANPIRLKSGDIEPMLEDFKDSSSTQENSDIVLSLFDVMRYANDKNGIEDPSGYDLGRLRDSKGNKKYRNLKILKNSYGSDDVRIGLAFQPEVGYFKEMKKRSEIRDEDYANIIDNSYFLDKFN